MKVIGVVLLLTGSAGVGLLAVRQLNARVTTLRSLTNAFDVMEHELDFRLPSMADWINDTARRSTQPAESFLEACVSGIGKNEGTAFGEIWKRAAASELPALKQCDIEIVMMMGTVLGRYDAESQRSTIAEARKRLTEHLASAVEERKRQGKVYSVLGATAGAFLVILLL